MLRRFIGLLFVAFAALSAACAPVAPASSAEARDVRAAPVPSSLTPSAMTPGQLYEKVAPSVVYVWQQGGAGSGFLVEFDGNKYVVTNWHVLWYLPDETLIIFADETVFDDLPLVGWDPLADVAVLGPVDTAVPALELATDGLPAIGDEVYNLGYPDVTEWYPQPSIARGIVSRLRQWDNAGITYVQTDVNSAAGQSGGVVVSQDGRVLGMTSYGIGEGNIDIAISAQSVADAVQAILDGSDPKGLGPRLGVGDDIDDGYVIALGEVVAGSHDYWGDVDVFRTELAEGQTVDILVESIQLDPYISVGLETGPVGALAFDDDSAPSFVGGSAYLYYVAPATDTYVILVDAYDEGDFGLAGGGYTISLKEAVR